MYNVYVVNVLQYSELKSDFDIKEYYFGHRKHSFHKISFD